MADSDNIKPFIQKKPLAAIIYLNEDTAPEEWTVEAVNDDDDGAVEMAAFSGGDAEVRAREYARLKYAKVRDHKKR